MSKVVKKVTGAVKKVVKGVAKVVKGVVKGAANVIRKVAKSPIGKALLMAATIYFGGAAVMGAMKGAAAGSGFMGTLSGAVSGAGAGITSAWNGLVGAGSALMGGQGLGAAGQSLSSGFMGQAGTSAAASAAGGLGTGLTPGASLGGLSAAPASGVNYALTAGSAAPGSGLIASAAGGGAGAATSAAAGSTGWASSMWNSLGPYGKMAAIQGGTQLVGGLVQGIGAQKQQDALWNREDQLAADERARRDASMGPLGQFGEATDSPYVDQYAQDPSQVGNPAAGMAGDPRYVRQPGILAGAMPAFRSSLDQFPRYTPRRFA
jgi:hypothetical protein